MNARLQHQPGDFIGPGQQQYQVLERLAVGGMGTVYKVENTLTGNAYAVKECDLLDSPESRGLSRADALDVFLSEGRQVERLSHPGIPKGFLLAHENASLTACCHCGAMLPPTATHCPQQPLDKPETHRLQKIDRRLYLFMDFIDGEEAVSATAGMPKPLSAKDLNRLCRWMIDVAEALAFLHQHQLIHRDVKPENIKITHQRAYLLDFGLIAASPESSKTRSLSEPTAFYGSDGYAPPEQVQGHPRAASDSFALAMTFLSLATGEDPSIPASAKRLLNEAPQSLVPHLSMDLATLLTSAREARPQHRPTMDQWVSALRQALEPLPSIPCPSHTKPLRNSSASVRPVKLPQQLRSPSTASPLLRSGKPFSFDRVPWRWFRSAKLWAFVAVVLLVAILFPSKDIQTFKAVALPGATIYSSMEDLRSGITLKEGDLLLLAHVPGGEDGNWLRVYRLNGKRQKGYLLRTKVFRSRP